MEVEQPTRGVLTSPNYPGHYPNNLNLVQKIQVPEGNTIWIRFTDFDCEPVHDWVFIEDHNGTRLRDYNDKPAGFSRAVWREQLVSTTNIIDVVFKTDGSVTRKGWRLEWGEYKVNSILFELKI